MGIMVSGTSSVPHADPTRQGAGGEAGGAGGGAVARSRALGLHAVFVDGVCPVGARYERCRVSPRACAPVERLAVPHVARPSPSRPAPGNFAPLQKMQVILVPKTQRGRFTLRHDDRTPLVKINQPLYRDLELFRNTTCESDEFVPYVLFQGEAKDHHAEEIVQGHFASFLDATFILRDTQTIVAALGMSRSCGTTHIEVLCAMPGRGHGLKLLTNVLHYVCSHDRRGSIDLNSVNTRFWRKMGFRRASQARRAEPFLRDPPGKMSMTAHDAQRFVQKRRRLVEPQLTELTHRHGRLVPARPH